MLANCGVMTNDRTFANAAVFRGEYNHAPPRQHAAKTANTAALVLARSGCPPNAPRSLTELIATNSVEPSWSNTASHSGNAPKSAGRAEPKMLTTASVMFCANTALVRRASAKSSGSWEMPSASA
jgi:hypothetical protein